MALHGDMAERASFVKRYFAEHYHGGGRSAVQQTMRDAQAAYKTRRNPSNTPVADGLDVGTIAIGAALLAGVWLLATAPRTVVVASGDQSAYWAQLQQGDCPCTRG